MFLSSKIRGYLHTPHTSVLFVLIFTALACESRSSNSTHRDNAVSERLVDDKPKGTVNIIAPEPVATKHLDTADRNTPTVLDNSHVSETSIITRRRSQILAIMRTYIDLIKNAADKDKIDGPKKLDVGVLVGMQRNHLSEALGEKIEPCKDGSKCERVLSLHKIPRGWRGGGLEISLLIDPSDTVVSAKKYYTR